MRSLLLPLLLIVAGAVAANGCGPNGRRLPVPATAGVDTVAADSAARLPASYSYAERQGKILFEHYCTVCHGQHGEGDGFNSYNLNPKPHSLADSAYVAALASNESLMQVIARGGRGINKSVLMPAYGSTLSEDQIADLAAYVRALPRSVPPRE